MFASLFVANLGSVGLNNTYHHLNEYGTASIFAAVGRLRTTLFVGPNDRPVMRDGLQVRYTIDERIADGLYAARALAHVREVVEDPAAQLGPPTAGTHGEEVC
jgi:pyruvate/2-oxoglutarate dehydrogenase complex dihydrolipoamide acyltransferase (E2) component